MTTFTIHTSAARWRSPAKYSTQPGWGHGTWAACARLAAKAGAGKLILAHHDRCRQDLQIDHLVRQARRIFPATHTARSGMRV